MASDELLFAKKEQYVTRCYKGLQKAVNWLRVWISWQTLPNKKMIFRVPYKASY
jgi:hypothetical protein